MIALTSSLESWLSLSKSICLNTFCGGGAWLIPISSTSNIKVAPVDFKAHHITLNKKLINSPNKLPPGITLPAPLSPYPRWGGIVSFLFSPIHMSKRPWEMCMMWKMWLKYIDILILTNTLTAQCFNSEKACLVPALNHLASTKLELEWLVTIQAGKLQNIFT